MAALGLGDFSFLEGRETSVEPGRTLFAAETVYADDSMEGDYVSRVITDPTLAQVVRILATYTDKTGKNLYQVVATTDEYREQYALHGNRITEYEDLVEQYDKPVDKPKLEKFNGFINVSEYPEITDLTGVNSAIKVTGFSVPRSFTEIPGKTFYDMKQLQMVYVPETVTAIGDGAFEQCEKLDTIYFYDSETLQVIAPVNSETHLPSNGVYLKGINKIGNSAFKSCKGIRTVFFGEDDPEYMENANVAIESDAFKSCTSLSDVTVPKGTLGTGVFSACHNLTSIKFDDSYKKIPDNTLSDINGELSITFPADLEEIGAYACRGDVINEMNLSSCSKLKTIGEYAFSNTYMKGTIGDFTGCEALEQIGREAFFGSSFESGGIVLPESVKRLGCSVFGWTSGINEITLPQNLTEIPDGTFMYSYDLVTVKGGNEVQYIGDHAFDLCGSLDYEPICQNMSKLVSIGDYAFARCIPAKDDLDDEFNSPYGLKQFQIGKNVESIGKSAFENDFMLGSISVDDQCDLQEIPDRFAVCEDAKSPTWSDVTLTDPLTEKEAAYPFKSSNEPAYKALRERFTYPKTISEMSRLESFFLISDKCEKIGDYAFFGNSKLKGSNGFTNQIILPQELTSIGKYAFANCAGHQGEGEEMTFSGIKLLAIPATVTSIGEYAFANDYNLEKVQFTEDLEEIPAHCFDGCGYDNLYKEEGSIGNVHHYHGMSCISDIKNIKSIGDCAFNNCFCLSQYGYNWALNMDCSTAPLEFGRNLEYLGKYAFAKTDISSASTLSYTKIDKLDEGVFDGCSSLTTVYSPDTMTSIENYAFRNCPLLDTVSFPVYATLKASIIEKNTQNITMTPTLGRYLNTRYRVPVGEPLPLPSNAFARRTTDKISQVYAPGHPEAGTDVELEDADPKYFSVAFNKEYVITGGDEEVLGTALRISATVPFTDAPSKTMNIDYPLDVISTHADPDSMVFDESKFKIDSASAGTVFEKDGEKYLYINKSKTGSTLTMSLNALATDEEYPGIITDKAVWTASDDSVVALEDGSITQVTSADKTTTGASFKIKGVGEASVSASFDDKSKEEDPTASIHILVVDPIKSVDYLVESVGEYKKNISTLFMPIDQTDVVTGVPTYSNEDDKRDFVTYRSSNPAIVTVDDKGNLKALAAGSARITIGTATGSTSRTLVVNIKDGSAYIAPVYINVTGPLGDDNKGAVYCGETATFKAECLPEYASQQVDWSIGSSADATLEVKDGAAVLKGVNANKNLTLTATATNGTTPGSVKGSLELRTHAKAASVEFREEPVTIKIEEIKNMKLSSDQSQKGGVVRSPEDCWEPVTFTSSNDDVLLIGDTSSPDKQEVALKGQTSTLYYKGVAPGTATITATMAGNVTAKFDVKVIRRPEDVDDAHADKTTMAFDSSKIKISGGTVGSLVDEKDGQALYINKSNVGKELTLVLDANSKDPDYPNMVTDEAEWTSSNTDAVALKDGSVTNTTGTEKTTTTAVFNIKAAGEAVLKCAFPYKDAAEVPEKTLKVYVVEPVKLFDYIVASVGEDNKNISSLNMPVGQEDTITALLTYTDESDKRDFVTYTSSDPEIVSVDANGKIKALKAGKTSIILKTATGSANKAITINIVDKDEYIAPLYVKITGPVADDGRGMIYCGEPATFKAECLPGYASQQVDWSIGSSQDAKLELDKRDAVLTGINANKNLTLTATATNGEKTGAKASLVVATHMKATAVEFREEPPTIQTGTVKSLKISSDQSQTNGVVRVPATCLEPVTFTSSDGSVLLLGTSSTGCSEHALTFTGASGTLYYKGLKPGKATITAAMDNGVNAKFEVNVIRRPEDVDDAHADQATMEFDQSGVKIAGGTAGIIFDDNGEASLYVNKNAVGKTLTISLGAKSKDPDYPNMITDDAVWTSSDPAVFALKKDSTTKTIGDDKTATTAVFDINAAGEATISAGFDDKSTEKDPVKTIKVTVVDPIKTVDFTVGSIGEEKKNISTITMPVKQKDAVAVIPTYTNETDTRDFVISSSSDQSVASLDPKGGIIALKPGTTIITMRAASGSASRSMTIRVVEEGAYVAPQFIEIEGPKTADSKGYVYCGEESVFKATCLPAYASQQVEWSIGSTVDASLAIKDGEAHITGVNANKTFTLTAAATDGTKTGSAKGTLTVATMKKADSVEFREIPPVIAAGSAKSLKLSSDEKQTNGIVRTPADSWDKVTFTSSDPTLLTLGTSASQCTEQSVTLSGQTSTLYYVGSRDGTATITAALENGKTSVLVVTVVASPVTSMKCTEDQVTLLPGKTAAMKLEITPEASTDPITYETSDEKIATVDGEGMIKAVAKGSATITARSKVNNRTASCKVTVLGKGDTVVVGKVTYTVNNDEKTLMYTKTTSTGKKITIPATTKISGNSYKVTKIAKSAFRSNTRIRKLVIKTNITWIGSRAFSDCKKLKTVQIKTKKLKKIGKRAFKNCKRGMTFKLPKSKYKKYKKMLKKSGVPAKTKFKKF